MNRTILYYPTINIPGNSWLRHALLYWDEISSIVPKSYDDVILNELSTDIHYLISEGQFRAIKPEDFIYKKDNWDEFHKFIEEFMQIVESDVFRRNINRKYNIEANRFDADILRSNCTSRIHNNKISDNIFVFFK